MIRLLYNYEVLITSFAKIEYYPTGQVVDYEADGTYTAHSINTSH